MVVNENWRRLAWRNRDNQVTQSQKERWKAGDTLVHKVTIRVYFPFIQIGDATLCQLLKAAGFCSENNIVVSNMCLFTRRAHTRSTPISKHDDRNVKHLNKDRHPSPSTHRPPRNHPKSELPKKDLSPALWSLMFSLHYCSPSWFFRIEWLSGLSCVPQDPDNHVLTKMLNREPETLSGWRG